MVSLSCPLVFPLLLALPPQQLPVNLRDFFEVTFNLVVVLDPAPNLVYFLTWNEDAGSPSQRDCEIPQWSVPLAFGAFAAGFPRVTYRSTSEPRSVSVTGGSCWAKPCWRWRRASSGSRFSVLSPFT